MKAHGFHPEADAEYADAAEYYAGCGAELGGRFYDEIERVIGEIKAATPALPPIRPACTAEPGAGVPLRGGLPR